MSIPTSQVNYVQKPVYDLYVKYLTVDNIIGGSLDLELTGDVSLQVDNLDLTVANDCTVTTDRYDLVFNQGDIGCSTTLNLNTLVDGTHGNTSIGNVLLGNTSTMRGYSTNIQAQQRLITRVDNSDGYSIHSTGSHVHKWRNFSWRYPVTVPKVVPDADTTLVPTDFRNGMILQTPTANRVLTLPTPDDLEDSMVVVETEVGFELHFKISNLAAATHTITVSATGPDNVYGSRVVQPNTVGGFYIRWTDIDGVDPRKYDLYRSG